MSAFLDKLDVEEIDDVNFKIVNHFFRYQSDIARQIFTVPVGFVTDFASVPRLGAVYAWLGNEGHEAAVVHDWLYYSAITTKDMADDVLLEALEVSGISWFKAHIFWLGVHVGGFVAWNGHRSAGDSAKSFKPSSSVGVP